MLKTGLTQSGFDPVFFSWPQNGVHWNQPSVDLMECLFNCLLFLAKKGFGCLIYNKLCSLLFI